MTMAAIPLRVRWAKWKSIETSRWRTWRVRQRSLRYGGHDELGGDIGGRKVTAWQHSRLTIRHQGVRRVGFRRGPPGGSSKPNP